ncbi:MAG: hypothetical protein KJ017_06970 [Alphaproteobacteria bacterium]|nr:hypothetical protein [Alphaproteobacteria bacterium]
MRKLLLLLAFLPLIAAIGHDVYNFTQNQEKGFRFADIGWIWSKYDPASHRQVNEELSTLIEQGEAAQTPLVTAEPVENEAQAPETAPQPEGAQPPQTGETPAEPVDDGTAMIRVKVQKNASNMPNTGEIVGNAAGFAAFLMQQQAVVVAACWAVLLLILMRLFGAVKFGGGKKDMDEYDELTGKKKSGSYKFKRK